MGSVQIDIIILDIAGKIHEHSRSLSAELRLSSLHPRGAELVLTSRGNGDTWERLLSDTEQLFLRTAPGVVVEVLRT